MSSDYEKDYLRGVRRARDSSPSGSQSSTDLDDAPAPSSRGGGGASSFLSSFQAHKQQADYYLVDQERGTSRRSRRSRRAPAAVPGAAETSSGLASSLGEGLSNLAQCARPRGNVPAKAAIVVATLVIVIFMHSAVTRALSNPHYRQVAPHGRPPHGMPPRPPPPGHHRPPPPGPPLEQADEDLPPIVLLDSDVQPRRTLRPSYPNPWAAEGVNWQGRQLSSGFFSPLSADAKFSREMGNVDPPQELLEGPPASHKDAARRFFVAQAKDYNKGEIPLSGPLPTAHQGQVRFDERTGRPLQVPHGSLFLGGSEYKPMALPIFDNAAGGAIQVEGLPSMPPMQAPITGQEDDEGDAAVKEAARRRAWVKRAFLHAWEGYKSNAWGSDELKPLSTGTSNNYNGWGATIVDALDMLLMLNMTHDYNLAREHVRKVDFTYIVAHEERAFTRKLPSLADVDPEERTEDAAPRRGGSRSAALIYPKVIPTFETAIRYLGGLISAYDLSHDPLMLSRATELGDLLLPALTTDRGIPIGHYCMGANPEGKPAGPAVLAEAGSLTLEFTRLSMITGDDIYYRAVQRTMDTLDTLFERDTAPAPLRGDGTARVAHRLGSLLPTLIDAARPGSLTGMYTFGGQSDSYYEYMIKQHLLISGAHPLYERMYKEAIESAWQYLIKPIKTVPGRDDLMVIASQTMNRLRLEVEHLTCFAGGMLGMGAKLLNRDEDMSAARNVTEACVWAYESTDSGVGPETVSLYDEDDSSRYGIIRQPDMTKVRRPRGHPVGVKSRDSKYIGRPESIESVFYMYRLTGDRKWQDYGWNMFTQWVLHAITPSGFASLSKVDSEHPTKVDSQESFVLAETLKYYYMLFSPREFMSLDDYVFNTEAHPFRIAKSDAPPFESLWQGPEPELMPVNEFVSSDGEGTPLQQWARVRQAAALNRAHRSGAVGGNGFRKLPPEELAQLKAAADKARAANRVKAQAMQGGGGDDGGARKRPVIVGAGGRGMGGGGVPQPGIDY